MSRGLQTLTKLITTLEFTTPERIAITDVLDGWTGVATFCSRASDMVLLCKVDAEAGPEILEAIDSIVGTRLQVRERVEFEGGVGYDIGQHLRVKVANGILAVAVSKSKAVAAAHIERALAPQGDHESLKKLRAAKGQLKLWARRPQTPSERPSANSPYEAERLLLQSLDIGQCVYVLSWDVTESHLHGELFPHSK